MFTGLVPDGYRLIVDFVSVDAVEGSGQRIWANFRSCTGVKPDGWGRIALPLSFAGFLNGESNWQGNVAMHTYLDPDCDARVRAWRPSSGSYANAKVTLQGHMVKTLIGR